MTILRRRGAPRQQDAIFRQCSVKAWISHNAPRPYGVPSMPSDRGASLFKIAHNRPRTHLSSMRSWPRRRGNPTKSMGCGLARSRFASWNYSEAHAKLIGDLTKMALGPATSFFDDTRG
jgi:hypothetical protein